MGATDPVAPKPRRFSARLPRRRLRFWVAIGMGIATVASWPIFLHVRRANWDARSHRCYRNLMLIGDGLRNYHAQYGCFPPVAVADENGRPMHSWRVLILPFVGAQDIYDKYRFEEPWDGPNNRRLAADFDRRFGQFMHCPSDGPHKDSRDLIMTSYLAIVGPEAVWERGKCRKLAELDDPANKLLVVEVANSGVHWMEPRDLDLSDTALTVNGRQGPGISSGHAQRAHAVSAGGNFVAIYESVPPTYLRRFVTIHSSDENSGNEH